MPPYNEFGPVETARLQERLNAVEGELAEVKRMLSEQGAQITGLRVDVSSFIAEVRQHIKSEEAGERVQVAWREAHEQRHDKEITRVYAALGILATIAVAASTLLVHWLH